MTLKEAQTIAKTKGFSIRHRDGEYRVNLIGGTEETAYYTDDREDAVNTGSIMAVTKLVKDMDTAVDVTIQAFEHSVNLDNINAMIAIRHHLAEMLSPIAATTPVDFEESHPGEILYGKTSQALNDMDKLIRSMEVR